MSVDALVATVHDADNALLLQDDSGNKYRLVPSGDTFALTKNGTVVGGLKRRIVAKTANYTCTEADNGTIFTDRGASGVVTFTLPAVATSEGLEYRFFAISGNLKVAGPADTLVVFNDAAADSIAFSTANEVIGAGLTAVCDGTSWLIFVNLGAETQTPTIAT